MKGITNLMIYEYGIDKLGYDFMGFKLQKKENYTYHHLIVPRRYGGEESFYNGAVLTETAHNYLHVIERYNLDVYGLITSEIIDEKITGIDIEHLLEIDKLLSKFEKTYNNTLTKKGKLLIKNEYILNRYVRSDEYARYNSRKHRLNLTR